MAGSIGAPGKRAGSVSCFSMTCAGRRQYSEDTATNIYYEQMATHWGNWATLFFNNKGVAAHGTDTCAQYPPCDPGVWVW